MIITGILGQRGAPLFSHSIPMYNMVLEAFKPPARGRIGSGPFCIYKLVQYMWAGRLIKTVCGLGTLGMLKLAKSNF